MVFHVTNKCPHKSIFSILIVSLLIGSIISLFCVQLSPVDAQNPAASLTGVTYDRAVDTDDDGIDNYLEIGVEINVSDAGTFRVEVVGLYDQMPNYIDIRNDNSTYLDTGIQGRGPPGHGRAHGKTQGPDPFPIHLRPGSQVV